ncbi:MAG: cellulase family glycosylhydrolase [Patescibacteria group bacterium]
MKSLNGVNLGGWLVLEKWMTPSVFKDTDARNEFELSKTRQGRERITAHHKSFITKKDLVWLKSCGVTILRVPVGHWIFGDDERYVGAIDRLDWLMDTSLLLGLQVLLDLHAAPGAQNRAAHSGSGNTVSNKYSIKWLNDSAKQAETIEILARLAERYRDFPNVWGIELLNEPAVDLTGVKLARFYRNAYRALSKVARPGTRIVFSDGYAPFRLTNCFWLMTKREFPVVLDTHVYQVFGKRNRSKTFERHIAQLRWTRRLLWFIRLQQPVIVGEWSAMLPAKTSPDETRAYVGAQQAAFDGTLAHFYWNYKTEAEGRWNYRDQAEKELLQ